MPHWSHAVQVHSLISVINNREFMPGKIAIVSRSGTLCYETVASTTRAQLGQSTVIGIGGDRMPGTTYLDALQMLSEDPTTEGSSLKLPTNE
jgi:succinyl-CoA synthetase alpha subunit